MQSKLIKPLSLKTIRPQATRWRSNSFSLHCDPENTTLLWMVQRSRSPHTHTHRVNERRTVGEGADGGGGDPGVDAPEAPRLVEALLTLQSGLQGVQRVEGQVHTHPGTAAGLETRDSDLYLKLA